VSFGWSLPSVASLLCFALGLLVVTVLASANRVGRVVVSSVGDTDNVIHLGGGDGASRSADLTGVVVALEGLGALQLPCLGGGALGAGRAWAVLPSAGVLGAASGWRSDQRETSLVSAVFRCSQLVLPAFGGSE
jgi:hypothetical protein